MPEALDTEGLKAIPDTGDSCGAHMLADPGLDLADPGSRRGQINVWLVQTALDTRPVRDRKLLGAH
jgi:hypothetical protein